MEDSKILELANKYRQMHGLRDWTMVVNNRLRTTAGQCRTNRRLIELSGHVMREWDTADVIDTILHEIAHALTPKDRGHGAEWQAKCVEIGAKPDRTYSKDLPVSKRFEGKCSQCDFTVERARRLAGAMCPRCASQILWKDSTKPEEGYREFLKSVVKGSAEWAKLQCKALGGTVMGDWLDAPAGHIWRDADLHFIDLGYSFYEGREGKKTLIADIEGGVVPCDCNPCMLAVVS